MNASVLSVWKRYIDDMTKVALMNQESTSLQNYTFFTVGQGGHPYKGCPQY